MLQLGEAGIQIIKDDFAEMQDTLDLYRVLNKVYKWQYPETRPNLNIEWLYLYGYLHKEKKADRYQTFYIPKKSGGVRIIKAPHPILKILQQSFNVILNILFQPHKAANGFVSGKSIVDNAKLHTNKHYVYNIDLKDFFSSISFYRVKAVLKLPPFNLTKKREDLAFLLANMCCDDGCLPQGAPTSPILTNIICHRMDRCLEGAAKRFGLVYSRYADDITFSSFHNVFQKNSIFNQEIERIIKEQGFEINLKKTRLQKQSYRQEVTGLVVNKRVNVSRQYIRSIRAMLHNWEHFGLAEANKRFIRHYRKDKGHIKNLNPDFFNVLSGKLNFLKMVRGENDLLYIKYEEQFEKLIDKTRGNFEVDIERLLNIWKKQGIEESIKLFYKMQKI